MLPRNPHNREALALLGLALAAVLWIAIHLAVAHADEPNRVEHYVCGHSHYTKFEDGSGILYCGRNVMVKVEVPW